MAAINLNKKLWRIPQQGMVRGVCAGIANYFDVPVEAGTYVLVGAVDFSRSGAVYAFYIILSFALDPIQDNMAFHKRYLPAANCWMKSTVNWRQVKRIS